MKKIIGLTLCAVPTAAFASVNAEDAMFYAVGKMAILGGMAYGWYKLLTKSIPAQNRTPSQQGRWLGALLSALSVLSYHKGPLADQVITTIIMLPVWFVIGYGLGYLYKKLKG